MDGDEDDANDLTKLKHVKPRADVRAAEEIGERTKCEDFEVFEPLFQAIREDLKSGLRKTRRYARMAGIKQVNSLSSTVRWPTSPTWAKSSRPSTSVAIAAFA